MSEELVILENGNILLFRFWHRSWEKILGTTAHENSKNINRMGEKNIKSNIQRKYHGGTCRQYFTTSGYRYHKDHVCNKDHQLY